MRHTDQTMSLDEAQSVAQRIIDNIQKVVIGKEQPVKLAVVALLCQGHILIEDVPGVGKTILARSLTKSTSCTFNRMQFTPDMLPSDVTGVSIFNQQSGEFEFKPGPIISQLVLADEINRATPKTQSALLEAMDERQVTVEGSTYVLPRPFTVIATQNPIEYEGTFPLPEAQLDRFFMTLTLGYPSKEQELSIIEGQTIRHPIEDIESVATPDEVIQVQETIKNIHVDDLIKQYIVSLVNSTRNNSNIELGSSPRGSLALYRGTQALALLKGRDFALPDDVKELAVPMLGHRIIASASVRMQGIHHNDLVMELLGRVEIPGAEGRGWLRT